MIPQVANPLITLRFFWMVDHWWCPSLWYCGQYQCWLKPARPSSTNIPWAQNGNLKMVFHSFLMIYCPIELQFCTCHDSYAVMACAKFWLNWIIDLRRVKLDFIEFRSWSHLCLLDSTPTRSNLHLFRSNNFLTSRPKALNQSPWGLYRRHLSGKKKLWFCQCECKLHVFK